MAEWFARPVLHVSDVEASLRFYAERLGFTVPWRYEEEGRVRVAEVDRSGCALILSQQWPEKVGKGLMFISLNVEPDLAHFSGIVPCGIGEEKFGVTSLVDLGLPVTMQDADAALHASFEEVFGPTFSPAG